MFFFLRDFVSLRSSFDFEYPADHAQFFSLA